MDTVAKTSENSYASFKISVKRLLSSGLWNTSATVSAEKTKSTFSCAVSLEIS
jgi:hypothetical protein